MPEPTGLLLRRYARGTFPRGRVEALALGSRAALPWCRADEDSVVEAPRGNDHGWRRACPEAKLGSPAPCCAPLIAERPQNRLGSGLEFRSQALAKEAKRGHVKRDHEGDVNLPKSRDNWRPPPMPPTPIYTHPYIKRRDWSLKGKSRLPGVGDDQGVGGTGEQGGADGDTAQHPPRKVSPGSLKHNIIHKQAATETTVIKHTQTRHRRWTGPQAVGRGGGC